LRAFTEELARKGPVAVLRRRKQTPRASPRPRLRFAGVYGGASPKGPVAGFRCRKQTPVRVRDPGSVLRAFSDELWHRLRYCFGG